MKEMKKRGEREERRRLGGGWEREGRGERAR
jgi:hypothetical protein